MPRGQLRRIEGRAVDHARHVLRAVLRSGPGGPRRRGVSSAIHTTARCASAAGPIAPVTRSRPSWCSSTVTRWRWPSSACVVPTSVPGSGSRPGAGVQAGTRSSNRTGRSRRRRRGHCGHGGRSRRTPRPDTDHGRASPRAPHRQSHRIPGAERGGALHGHRRRRMGADAGAVGQSGAPGRRSRRRAGAPVGRAATRPRLVPGTACSPGRVRAHRRPPTARTR